MNVFHMCNVLPFFNLSDEIFNALLLELQCNNINLVDSSLLSELNSKLFDQFDANVTDYCNDDADSDYFILFNETINSTKYILNTDINLIDKEISSNNLSIYSHNINSLSKHFEELKTFLNNFNDNFDVISLVETKLSDDIEQLYELSHYNKVSLNNKRNSGGLMIYVRNNLEIITIRNDLTYKNVHLECLFVEIKLNKTESIIFGNMYRRPNTNIDDYLNSISDILLKLERESKKVIISGDININLLNYKNNNKTLEYLNLFRSHNFLSLINKPTRVRDNSHTLIDHTWSNDYANFVSGSIILNHISDHFPTISNFKLSLNKIKTETYKYITYREFSDLNHLKFSEELSQVQWDLVLTSTDANIAYSYFSLFICNVFEKCFPFVTRKFKVRYKDKKYITPQIRSLMRERDKLYKKYVKYPITYGNEYHRLRNRVTNMIKSNKRSMLREQLNEASGNSRDTWAVINNVLNKSNATNCENKKFIVNNEELCNPSDIANAFNNFYVNIGSDNLINNNVDKLDSVNNVQVDNDNVDNTHVYNSNEIVDLLLSDATEEELVSILSVLKNTAAGVDGLPMTIIKKNINVILNPLLHICNLSMQTGVFPSDLKIAKVKPLYKKDNKCNIENYRPISILPAFSKVIERLICNRLVDHLDNNNIICNNQHGFRRGRSTTSAVLTVTDSILRSFDGNKYSLAVFIDLSKAFNMVDHKLLLDKLNLMGVRGVAFDWFKNYLHQRKQYVNFNNVNSDYKFIERSVPQGSILGPILFNIYINDIVETVQNVNITLFADDCCIFYSHTDLNILKELVNSDLKTVYDWIIYNKLAINFSKCHYILFSRKRNTLLNNFRMVINDNEINRVSFTNFLGIIIDEKLNWKKHVTFLVNKLNKYRAIMFLTRTRLTKNSLKLIYYSLIYSNVLYGNVIWGNSNNSILKPLETAQKKIIRTIMFRDRYAHTSNDFYILGLLKYMDVNFFASCVFTYKSLYNIFEPKNYFFFVNNNRYNLRNNLELRLPQCTSVQGQRSPAYYCARNWNSLPSDLKDSSNIFIFKRRLKNYLLSGYQNA